jgi:hypothetical protein
MDSQDEVLLPLRIRDIGYYLEYLTRSNLSRRVRHPSSKFMYPEWDLNCFC